MSKILLVEDELDLSNQIRDWLTREHYLVETQENGEMAYHQLRVSKYDLIILDWQLPGMSGIDICKQYRSTGGKSPVLMLTARSAIDDREKGLDAGADDYLCKPFHLKELSARVRALIRRSSIATTGTNVLHLKDISLDPSARRVTKGGADVKLEPKEFSLLEFLMRNRNIVFSADALLDRVWESDTSVSPDSIRTYIKALRKKLDNAGETSHITTVHGLGYRLEDS
ncbi:MAG: response regulator transcription factor [Candidatus Obscuribacterales bacterium]|jgi:DNA-binding response OmpR family regulator|nr:response regulator transcription factor [Candidatus Obscuribacterales bacterium]MBX9942423.1 response regulator transcription factor [Candidatus Obscuribacterales bacterium]